MTLQIDDITCIFLSLQDFLEDLWSRIQTLMENSWRVESGKISNFKMIASLASM